ncbi:ABC transporter [Chloropicon primus]|uniref:ABC transporter n=1 Tax=Chloropicon primus TaxID=1764295 RepID=A0A5B8MSB1_9CHLO|nr:ABC transporter [Chloropicon primus]UPR01399.1 ABC transporter [Chloropicon primus]|eukprot:QDZ22182.1 ABC transporter [Chloropicon primus]
MRKRGRCWMSEGDQALVDLLRRSLRQYTPLTWVKFSFAILGTIGANLCFLALPMQVPTLVAALDSPSSSSSSASLLSGCLSMVTLYLLRVVLSHGGRHCLESVGVLTLLNIQGEIFSSAQRLTVEDFEMRFGLGDVLGVLEHDAAVIRDVLTVNLERVLTGLIYVVGGIYLCLVISTFLTVVIFCAILPIGLASVFLKKISETFGKRLSEKRSLVVSREREILGCARLVRSHRMEREEERSYRRLGEEYNEEANRYSAFMSICKGGSGLTHSFALMMIIYFGVSQASTKDGLGSGQLVALINIVVEIGKHLEGAVQNYLLISAAGGNAKKIRRILDAATHSEDIQRGQGDGPSEIDRIKDSPSACILELRGCTYLYNDEGTTRGVENISFEAKPGEILCLVGPSGCGKSTTLDLVALFRPCQAGKILFHGVDTADLSLGSCRSLVSWVGQTNPIVPGTSIRDNIAYGMHLASDEDVLEAIKLSACDDFLDASNLHQSFDHGFNLSGGQRARVSIARGLLKVLKGDAKILLLDEACANLDAVSESSLLSSIRTIVKTHRIACLFVTHRMNHTAKIADKVLVLKGGRLREEGTHVELSARKGIYSTLLAASSESF